MLVCISISELFIQADFLEPHLHGIVAFFNFMLVRSDFFESSAKGKLVCSDRASFIDVLSVIPLLLVLM